jgi:hypothetical protein
MANTNLSSLSVEQLKKAVQIKEEIARLENQLAALLGGGVSRAGGRGVMSAEARERIAAAQRARWARYNAGKTGAKTTSAATGKRGPRTMSAAARARIAAAQRARWAKAKSGKA